MGMRTSILLLSKGELAFLASVAICLATSSALLPLVGRESAGLPSGQERIGTIVFKNRYAERKAQGKVIWNATAQSAPVYDLDSIRTAAASSAVISLVNGVEISLGEESLVLLDFRQDRAKVSVGDGSVELRTAAAGRELSVDCAAGEVSLKSGALSIRADDAGAAISLVGGSAVLHGAASARALSGDVSIDSSGKIAPAPSVALAAPAEGELVFAAPAGPGVLFRWKAGGPGAQAGSWVLSVARDRDFTVEERRMPVSGGEATLQLPAGLHYWRLLATGEARPASAIGWFTLAELEPPRLIGPLNRRFSVDETSGLAVDFSWSPSANASSYRLSIAKKGQPQAPAITKATVLSALTVESIAPGDYIWSVSSLSGPGLTEAMSRTGEFSVLRGESRLVLRSASGREGAVESLSALAIRNGAVVATWDPVEGAKRYDVSISREPDGARVVREVSTNSTVLQLGESLEKGDYYVSVRAVLGTMSPSAAAELKLAVTGPTPPVPVTPIAATRLDPATRDLRFQWEDANEGHSYRIVVAKDRDLRQVLAEKTIVSRWTDVELPDDFSGTFFWKVALLDEGMKPIMDSPIADASIQAMLAAPKALSPANGQELDINSIERIDFGWEAVAGADEYRVSLYRTTGGLREAVKTWSTKRTKATFDHLEALALASYSWELRAAASSADGRPRLSRPVDSYFRIVQSSPLPAPRIRIGAER
jgi:hypothetical protein